MFPDSDSTTLNVEEVTDNDNSSIDDNNNNDPPIKPINNIQEICNIQNIKRQGYSESCVKICMPGACCYMEELHALTSYDILEHPQEIKFLYNKNNYLKLKDCSIDYPDICADYGYCKNLFHSLKMIDAGIANDVI